MNCGEGRTCHFACDCREADFAAKLVAADHCRASADRALYAERCRVVDLEKKLAALEERARRAEDALRHAARELQYIADDDPCHRLHQTEEGLACIRLAESLIGPMREWPEEPNATQATGFRVWKVAARIAPPPEAEKKGDNDGR